MHPAFKFTRNLVCLAALWKLLLVAAPSAVAGSFGALAIKGLLFLVAVATLAVVIKALVQVSYRLTVWMSDLESRQDQASVSGPGGSLLPRDGSTLPSDEVNGPWSLLGAGYRCREHERREG